MRRTRSGTGVWAPRAFVGVGLLLGGIILVESLHLLLESGPIPVEFVAGVITNLPFVVFLAVGGYWLPRTSISPDRYQNIAVWTVGAGVFIGGFFILLVSGMNYGFWVNVAILRWGIAIGTGGGFLAGFMNARSLERAAAAERETARAEAADEQRELLEYMNSVLRHEVLNTANVIQGYAATLDGDAIEGETATIIQDEADELTCIIKDVRILLESIEGNEELEPMDIATVVNDELQKIHRRRTDVETEVRIPPDAYVSADDLIRRLFANLFNNAVEHNESDIPRVSVTGTVTSDTVTIQIADNGPGIPDDEREDLFDPTVDMGIDHGLGLVIVGRLADRYDGRIALTDTGPDGSEFTLELPRATPPANGVVPEPVVTR